VPPGTSGLVQQLSLLAPQLVSPAPAPVAKQLGGTPHEPALQFGADAGQATGLPHTPAVHTCTLLNEH